MFNRIFATVVAISWPTLLLAQYLIQTYPDPRTNHSSCAISSPGHLCDPKRLLKEVNSIQNKSPACLRSRDSKLEILVAVVEKVAGNPPNSEKIEKFTNSLKTRYQNHKTLSECDNLILIVNSKKDRQVYTVAGRDVMLTKDVLKNAFVENIQSFKVLRDGSNPDFPQLSVNGVETREKIDFSKSEKVPAKTALLTKSQENSIAVARCDVEDDQIGSYVQAVVEDAMSLSLRLIKDARFTQIEESIQNVVKIENGKNRVWQEASEAFIEDLYKKYATYIKAESVSSRCPVNYLASKKVTEQ
uniref:DUF4476 domain-containing protein n=1 Tax=Syphacia muris TaxID=451379 RepID=A0A0N5AEN5_9BILA